jgi:hypothetical protein
LNKVEMLPWDVWGAGWEPGDEPSDELLECFDSAAALTVNPDANFVQVRRRYDSDASLRSCSAACGALRTTEANTSPGREQAAEGRRTGVSSGQ